MTALLIVATQAEKNALAEFAAAHGSLVVLTPGMRVPDGPSLQGAVVMSGFECEPPGDVPDEWHRRMATLWMDTCVRPRIRTGWAIRYAMDYPQALGLLS